MAQSNKAGSVLIVDDSPEDIRLLLDELKEEYSVTAAISANAAYASLEKHVPDIIILDINLPDENGYDVCRRLKADSKTKDVEVVFLSANETTEQIMLGYDAGAFDYVVKPYSAEALKLKISKTLTAHKERLSLASAADSAVKTAMAALADSGDLGVVVRFMRESFAADRPDLLASKVIECISNYQLDGSVLLKRAGVYEIFSTSGQVTTIEEELLNRLLEMDQPILEKERRLFVAQRNMALVIKRLPDDAGKRGRLRDYLTILCEGVNARLDAITESMKSNVKRELSIRGLVVEAENSLREILELQLNHKKTSMKILDDMVHGVEQSFFPMGLTDTQEEQLLNLLHEGVEKALDHFEHGLHIDEKVKKIIHSLAEINKTFH